MLRLTAAFALVALTACGADAPPEPPVSETATGVSLSGCVEMGIVTGKPAEGRSDC